MTLSGTGKLQGFPPLLAFSSVVDATVSTPALVEGLFERLPAGNHELVLFDINRMAEIEPIMKSDPIGAIRALRDDPDRAFAFTLVTNRTPNTETSSRAPRNPGMAPRRRRTWVYPGRKTSTRWRTSPCRFHQRIRSTVGIRRRRVRGSTSATSRFAASGVSCRYRRRTCCGCAGIPSIPMSNDACWRSWGCAVSEQKRFASPVRMHRQRRLLEGMAGKIPNDHPVNQ